MSVGGQTFNPNPFPTTRWAKSKSAASSNTHTNPFVKAFQQTLLLQHQTPSALIQEETQYSQQWFLSSMQQAVCKQHSMSSTKRSHGRSGWQEESSIKHAKLKRELWLHNESELPAKLHEIPTAKVAQHSCLWHSHCTQPAAFPTSSCSLWNKEV